MDRGLISRLARFFMRECSVLLLAAGFSAAQSDDLAFQTKSNSWVDSLQPWSEFVLQHLETTTPQELIQQKRVRNRFHRTEYPGILLHFINQDGLGALISFIRVSMHVEYSMTHQIFWIIGPDPASGQEGVAFPDDWAIPPDPWKREWWYKE